MDWQLTIGFMTPHRPCLAGNPPQIEVLINDQWQYVDERALNAWLTLEPRRLRVTLHPTAGNLRARVYDADHLYLGEVRYLQDYTTVDGLIQALQQQWQRPLILKRPPVDAAEPGLECWRCGCTDATHCQDAHGPCQWARRDTGIGYGLCTHCASSNLLEAWDTGAIRDEHLRYDGPRRHPFY